jgi:hypothetical protein
VCYDFADLIGMVFVKVAFSGNVDRYTKENHFVEKSPFDSRFHWNL